MNDQRVTSTEARVIIRSGRFTLSVVGDEYVMTGGYYGTHSLSVHCTDAKRLHSHWIGYCRQQQHGAPAEARITFSDVVSEDITF